MNKAILAVLTGLATGFVLTQRYPFPADDLIPQLMARVKPNLYDSLMWSWTAMLYTTPMMFFSGVFSLVYVHLGAGAGKEQHGELAPFPAARDDKPFHLVIGEVQHPRRIERVAAPRWLTIPERGLATNIAVFGSTGSGKTSAALRPFATQIFNWNALNALKKIGGLVLEVKGDFCYQVCEILTKAKRPDDYIELNLSGAFRYNPIHGEGDAFAIAFNIATLFNQLYGKGKEPFWQQAYTNLMKNIILLYKTVDDYCTLYDIYLCSIDPATLHRKIQEGEAMFKAYAGRDLRTWVVIDPMALLTDDEVRSAAAWEDTADGMRRALVSDDLLNLINSRMLTYTLDTPEAANVDDARMAEKIGHFEAVKRWFLFDWSRIKPDLRTSVVEGLSVTASLFDSDLPIKYVFCPPKELYFDPEFGGGKNGVPLPCISDLVESGKVLALNFPMHANPAASKLVTSLLKLEFQRVMMARIPKMARSEKTKYWRNVLFLCDEYHELATTGETDPNGDERFFALSRQSKCIGIVATQSISSLKSALRGDSWRTLLQGFRTQIYLSVADSMTAGLVAEAAGRVEDLITGFSISENASDAKASMLGGQMTSHKGGLSVSKNYRLEMRPRFESSLLTQLGNAVSVVFAFDGLRPLTPTLCYLKPHFLDRNKSYFDQVRDGEL